MVHKKNFIDLKVTIFYTTFSLMNFTLITHCLQIFFFTIHLFCISLSVKFGPTGSSIVRRRFKDINLVGRSQLVLKLPFLYRIYCVTRLMSSFKCIIYVNSKKKDTRITFKSILLYLKFLGWIRIWVVTLTFGWGESLHN